MPFIVPLRRIVGSPLEKAYFERGPLPGHKYIRRERRLVGGKFQWIYWYADKHQLEAGQKEHADAHPGEEVKHHLWRERAQVYKHLAKIARTAEESTPALTEQLLHLSKVKVSRSAQYEGKFHDPSIRAEKAGKDPGKSPSARVARAVELVPESVRKLLEGIGADFEGLKKIHFNTWEENIKLLGPERAGRVAGFAQPDGSITLSMFPDAWGRPGFQGSFAAVERTVWHEMGHMVHWALEAMDKKLIADWKAMEREEIERISQYAMLGSPGREQDAWMEDFAECIACAIAFPKELATVCPKHYDWIRKNVVTELPSRKEIGATPDEELAWWDQSVKTPAGKLLSYLKMKEPSPQFADYHSEKDQFYTLSRNGKTVYFRLGPLAKSDEIGWRKRPPTFIDYDTGRKDSKGKPITIKAPALDHLLGALFHATVKEIYDEFGHPLTDKQAYFYLGQYDEDVQGQSFGGEIKEYEKWIDEKSKVKSWTDTQTLGFKMHDALGYRKEHSRESEEKRIQDAIAKGKDPSRSGWSWAPTEITEDQFLLHSGSFKFSKMTAAAVQKSVAREDGKEILIYDPKTKKKAPLLTAKTYEQKNPDGSVARIEVCMHHPFSKGDTALLPVTKKGIDPETGREITYTDWDRVTITSDPDPYKLARRYKTTATEILRRNHKYSYGQIMDPVLAALINPGGTPIHDEATLQFLMRTAAQERSRAWVSIKTGTALESPIAHLEVEFDGQGPPRVLGDHWARRLGKDEVRVDEILNLSDDLKVDRIQVRRPVKPKLELGSLVWVADPKTKKRVLATYVEATTEKVGEETKTVHTVEAISGQVSGAEKGRFKVTEFDRAMDDEIPGQPGIRHRFVSPLKDTVLLYMDLVPRESGESDPRGTIKMLLPESGAFTIDDLMRVPGVSLLEPVYGEKGTQMVIDPSSLPALRKILGGFSMDSRVRARMDALVKEEAARQEQFSSEEVVRPDELEDKDGNVNPEGLLKGIVTGKRGLQPSQHRIECLQKLARNGGVIYAAHGMGTGKTGLAIMASAMMRHLRDPKDKTKRHPSGTSKRTLMIIDRTTAENWRNEFEKFGGEPAALLGASSIPTALGVPDLPERRSGESDGAYKGRCIRHWKERCEADPRTWNPFVDSSRNVVIGYEYFREHEDALRLLDDFDGMVVDEAQGIARDNQLSQKVREWRPRMKLFMMMSGTPITDTLKTLPRIVDILSDGKTKLGTEEEFEQKYLIESASLKAQGRKKAPRRDLHPMRIPELMSRIQSLFHVVKTGDVRGKAMPAVLIDENQPAHMIGQQARAYRGARAMFTPEERAAMEHAGAVGADEAFMLSPQGKARAAVARSISNSPGYKTPSDREMAQYTAQRVKKDKRGRVLGFEEVSMDFVLPSYELMTTKKPKGWGSTWPKASSFEHDPGYYEALCTHFDRLLGVTYESLEGKPIDRELLRKIKDGFELPTKDFWGPQGGKIRNPDYGPEGAICRGELIESSQEIVPLGTTPETRTLYEDPLTGKVEEVVVPIGKKFIRDPNQKTRALYYDEKDWDEEGKVDTDAEREVDEEEKEKEDKEEYDKDKKDEDFEFGDDGPEDKEEEKVEVRRGFQKPKAGHEHLNLTRSPQRRRERVEFDMVMALNNAKCRRLEHIIRDISDAQQSKSPDEQLIIFGNRIGSSVRTAESKLRLMGYMDVNEALGHPAWSSEADKKRADKTRKFFVTFMGVGATLGDRALNSEIFRRQQDAFGKDTGVSMLVWRALYGTQHFETLKVGELGEGFSRAERKRIGQNFVDEVRGKTRKDGRPMPMEMPMRVGAFEEKGQVVHRYVYETEMKPKDRREFARLEKSLHALRHDPAATAETHARMREILTPYWTDRMPLSDRQMDIMNSTQVVVASDAANVGLNWPAGHLVMYDSLFSPMEEAQRIARAARMLPNVLGSNKELRGLITKVGAYISKIEKENNFREYEGRDSAMAIVREAMKSALTPDEQKQLKKLPGGASDQVLEAWFAKRAFDKIDGLRAPVLADLRRKGRKVRDEYVPAEAITEADVMSEILEKHLTDFDREILKSRRYMVHVHRLTTSTDMPEFVETIERDLETGKKKKVRHYTGGWTVESPTMTDRSQLAQGRSKMVPFERAMNEMQTAHEFTTNYDYVLGSGASLGKLARVEKSLIAEVLSRVRMVALSPPPATKSVYYVNVGDLS